MGSQDNLISKEFLLELNRLVSLKELQLESLDNLGATIMWIINYARRQIPMCQIWMDFFTFLGGYPENKLSAEGLQSSESDGDFTEPNILQT
ncbi:MAG TPA: hypothetical protein VF220_04950 [Nitrososphaeraceae archaeon]